MKNTKQIHQLLQDAIEYKGDYAYDYIIKKCTEALALLPCETCNDTGKIMWGMFVKDVTQKGYIKLVDIQNIVELVITGKLIFKEN